MTKAELHKKLHDLKIPHDDRYFIARTPAGIKDKMPKPTNISRN